MKWIDDESGSFATRLVSFAIVEGLFFISCFASFFWKMENGLFRTKFGKSNGSQIRYTAVPVTTRD